MSVDKEPFAARWSRRKTEARDATPERVPPPPAQSEPKEPPPELPKIEALTPESDFTPFMRHDVDLGTRREALKKLFTDAHFNLPDPYEAYSEDYTLGETLDPEIAKTLNQARRLLFDEKAAAAEAEEERTAQLRAQHETAAPSPDAPQAADPAVPATGGETAAPNPAQENEHHVAASKDA